MYVLDFRLSSYFIEYLFSLLHYPITTSLMPPFPSPPVRISTLLPTPLFPPRTPRRRRRAAPRPRRRASTPLWWSATTTTWGWATRRGVNTAAVVAARLRLPPRLRVRGAPRWEVLQLSEHLRARGRMGRRRRPPPRAGGLKRTSCDEDDDCLFVQCVLVSRQFFGRGYHAYAAKKILRVNISYRYVTSSPRDHGRLESHTRTTCMGLARAKQQ